MVDERDLVPMYYIHTYKYNVVRRLEGGLSIIHHMYTKQYYLYANHNIYQLPHKTSTTTNLHLHDRDIATNIPPYIQ